MTWRHAVAKIRVRVRLWVGGGGGKGRGFGVTAPVMLQRGRWDSSCFSTLLVAVVAGLGLVIHCRYSWVRASVEVGVGVRVGLIRNEICSAGIWVSVGVLVGIGVGVGVRIGVMKCNE